jgi:hypothetical protein
MMVLSVQ